MHVTATGTTPLETAAAQAARPRLGRSVALGAVAGFVTMTVIVFLAAGRAGAPPAGSLGLALFGAFWGGLGFGAMVGGVVCLARQEHGEVG